MKNPNGYGSIFKLSGKRRKPWAVRITTGWTEEGKQIYGYLGYYKTRPEAVAALADYNKNPYDLSEDKMTYKDMYELFKKERFPKFTKQNKNIYNMSFNLSSKLHDLIFKDIRKHHMQSVIDNCDKSHETKKKIKTLFNQLYKIGMENDLVEKDYARFVEMPSNITPSERKPFSVDEIDLLWDNVGKVDYVDTILIMIYTGLRPGELVEIKKETVNLEERFFRGGFKTVAGTNRIIPIHKKIHHLIDRRMMCRSDYLITNNEGYKMTYDAYYNAFNKVINQLKLDHKPHNCRHTFATMMDNSGANKISIKRIMGHASQNVTDSVYTHKDVEQLIIAIDMLE